MAVVEQKPFQVAPGCKWRVVHDELGTPKVYSAISSKYGNVRYIEGSGWTWDNFYAVDIHLVRTRHVEIAVLAVPNCRIPDVPINPFNFGGGTLITWHPSSLTEVFQRTQNFWSFDGGRMSSNYTQVGPVEYRETYVLETKPDRIRSITFNPDGSVDTETDYPLPPLT
jgi:hypothetical protein